MGIGRVEFGRMGDGRAAHLYTLVNANGVEAKITNFGGILVSLKVPDRDGGMDDVVLGYDTLNEYVNDPNYFGCVVGRYANRIAIGRFSIGGDEYTPSPGTAGGTTCTEGSGASTRSSGAQRRRMGAVAPASPSGILAGMARRGTPGTSPFM